MGLIINLELIPPFFYHSGNATIEGVLMMPKFINKYSRVIVFLLLVALISAGALSYFKQEFKEQFNLGRAYYNQGKYEDAVDAYKQAIRIYPYDERLYGDLGITYQRLGKYQEAVDAFKQAIKNKPDYSEAYFSIGTVYVLLDRYQEAVDSYKQAIRINPYYAEAHFSLGFYYILLGDKGAALEEYETLKNLNKEQAYILFNEINK